MSTCLVCGKVDLESPFTALEMMIGTRAGFQYATCPSCGTVSLLDPPTDWSTYYAREDYYAFDDADVGQLRSPDRLKAAAVSALLKVRLPKAIYDLDNRLSVARWFRGLGVRPSSRILDVGTGAGRLLRLMASVGFTDLCGVDPFAPASRLYPDGVSIIRGELDDLEGPFVVIMFHHSLEHVEDPAATLRSARRILSPEGCCIVRVPVADSWAFRHYGPFWVQLDAPRHRFLFTRKGVRLIAEQADFVVQETFTDSDAFQLWGSEMYRQGIPLLPVDEDDHRSRDSRGCKTELFTPDELRGFRRRAAQLNAKNDGDQACFILRPNSRDTTSGSAA